MCFESRLPSADVAGTTGAVHAMRQQGHLLLPLCATIPTSLWFPVDFGAAIVASQRAGTLSGEGMRRKVAG